MKRLTDHNHEQAEMRLAWEAMKTRADVACDKCGTEMHFISSGIPGAVQAQGHVRCPKCGYSGYKD